MDSLQVPWLSLKYHCEMEMESKIKTVIVDDEPGSIEALKWELQAYENEVEVLATFQSSLEALEKIPGLAPDLVFLDIEMPVLNGFDLLKRLGKSSFDVIFTTAYDQFAIKAFKVNAVDYLLKPIDEDELRKAIGRVQQRRAEPATQQQLEQLFEYLQKHSPDFPTVALPTLEGLEFVEVDDILHCESSSNYTYIYLTTGEKILVSKTLKELETLLTGHHFCRVHHSHMVNLKHVRRYIRGKGGELVLKDGTVVPVSRAKKEDLLKLF